MRNMTIGQQSYGYANDEHSGAYAAPHFNCWRPDQMLKGAFIATCLLFWCLCADAQGHCDGTGCAATVGNDNWAYDNSAPTVSVLTPSTGPVSGSVNATAACTDPVGVSSVSYALDGVTISTALTTVPYTLSLVTSNYVDGVHNLTAICTNVSGVTLMSVQVTLTFNNSVSARDIFVDPSGGSDSNNCLSSSTACKTWDHVMSALAPFHAGDMLAQKAGTNFSMSSQRIILCGPASSTCSQNFYPAGASYTTTISTYGGGTCAPIAGTLSGCATITVAVGSRITDGAIYLGNVSNVMVSNFNCIGTNIIRAQSIDGSACIHHRAGGNVPSTLVTITNNRMMDWKKGIYSEAASTITSTISNNLVTASTSAFAGQTGIDLRFNNSGNTVQGNVISNMGGDASNSSGYYPGCCGNGITIRDGSGLAANGLRAITDQFNVTYANGANNITCGGPVGNWAFGATVIIQFNESYLMGPASYKSGCDWDGLDFDKGVRDSIMRFNYAHDNFGAGIAIVASPNNQASRRPIQWVNNQLYGNISENDNTGASSGMITGAFWLTSAGSQPGGTNSYFFNNTSSNTITGNGHVSCLYLQGNPSITFANNICDNEANSTAAAMVLTNNVNTTLALLKNNDYFTRNAPTCLFFWNGSCYVTLAAFQAATGQETGSLTSNPLLTTPVMSGPGTTCSPGNAITVGPQNQPSGCPSGMKLQHGSPMVGVGLNMKTAFGITNPTRDYYGNSCPNGVGTGYNIGADACSNP